MSSIKLIKQVHETGCGIACVAMISNKSYEEIKLILVGENSKKTQFYTRAKKDLIPILGEINIDAEIKKSKSWDDINGVAIVGVNRKPNGYFHWVLVIKDKNKFIIIDPEEAEVYQGSVWADDPHGYIHSKNSSEFISINIKISTIKI